MVIVSGKKGWGFSLLLPVIFTCLLLLPTVDTCFHVDRAPIPNEQRQLAVFPHFQGLSQIKPFIAGVESYFNDHFGYRKRLIRTNNRWKLKLVGESGPVGSVCIGLEGWLFWLGENMMDNYTGVTTFSEQDLKDWQKLLERRRDWLAKRGCRYLFVVTPDKHTIYSERLPSWVNKSKRPIKLEQFLDYMRAHSTVQIVDMRHALIEAKSIHPTYLMTDTHWNAFGGFIGYQEVMKALSIPFPDLSPLPLSCLEIAPISMQVGDIGRFLSDNHIKENTAYSWSYAKLDVVLKEKSEPDRLPFAWTPDKVPISSFNPKARRKAVLFRDSFSRAWFPYLGQHFGEVIYIWRYYWDAPFLEREKPDVVIDEMLERFLNTENPKEFMAKENLDLPETH